jgi:hypothetical protein
MQICYTVYSVQCTLYTLYYAHVVSLPNLKRAVYSNGVQYLFSSYNKSFFHCLLQDLPVEGRPSYVNCDLPEPRGSVPPVLLPQGGGRSVSGLPSLLPPLGRPVSGLPTLLPPLGRPGGGLIPALSPPLVQAPAAPTLSLYLPPPPVQQPPTDPDTGSPSHQVTSSS